MKLFPSHKYPPPVKAWHVPISKIKFDDIVDETWDITMKKVIKQIDGISEVRRIARNADVALDLTKNALQHLLYYDNIIMIDIFLFGNIYAPTPNINDFVNNIDNMQEDCANYVFVYGHRLPNSQLCRFLTSLCTGRTVKEWLKLHYEYDIDMMEVLDVRRLIHFAIIKGLVYRVHKYAVSTQFLTALETGEEVEIEGGDLLQKYTDGCHHFDQIAMEKNMGDEKVMNQLRRFPKGDVEIYYR